MAGKTVKLQVLIDATDCRSNVIYARQFSLRDWPINAFVLAHRDSGTCRKTIKRKGKQSTLDAERATITEARKAMKYFQRESFEKASWVY